MDADAVEQRTDAISEEIGVFEKHEQAKVEQKREKHKRLAKCSLTNSSYRLCNEIVADCD